MELLLHSMSREINRLLWAMGCTVSAAESCSAGRIATYLTLPAGSSSYFRGSMVCYANDLKVSLLGVDKKVIETNSAVCEEVARQMVTGALQLFHTDYALAMTGFAGPTGGTPDNPLGTIWVAVGNKNRSVTKKVYHKLGREMNTIIATAQLLRMFLDFLIEDAGNQ